MNWPAQIVERRMRGKLVEISEPDLTRTKAPLYMVHSSSKVS